MEIRELTEWPAPINVLSGYVMSEGVKILVLTFFEIQT